MNVQLVRDYEEVTFYYTAYLPPNCGDRRKWEHVRRAKQMIEEELRRQGYRDIVVKLRAVETWEDEEGINRKALFIAKATRKTRLHS